MRMGDLSSQSGDHGVNVNPASASRIEVVRGPATLLYGANAIGGLVNVITNEIPTAPVMTPTGSFTVDGGLGGEGRRRGRRCHGRQRDRRAASERQRPAGQRLPVAGRRRTELVQPRARSRKSAWHIRPPTASSAAATRYDRIALRHPVRRGRRDESESAATDLHAARRSPQRGRVLRFLPRVVRRPALPARRARRRRRSRLPFTNDTTRARAARRTTRRSAG